MKATLLHIDASLRGERSLFRRFSQNFIGSWLASSPDTRVRRRKLAAAPPPYVDQAWITVPFTDTDARTPEMTDALAASDELISKLEAADVIVLGDDSHKASIEVAIYAIPVLAAAVFGCLHADRSAASADAVIRNNVGE